MGLLSSLWGGSCWFSLTVEQLVGHASCLLPTGNLAATLVSIHISNPSFKEGSRHMYVAHAPHVSCDAFGWIAAVHVCISTCSPLVLNRHYPDCPLLLLACEATTMSATLCETDTCSRACPATIRLQNAFHARIAFCLNLHNEAVKAMRFEPDAHKRALAAVNGRKEMSVEEIAKAIEEEEDEGL
eukprot:GHUV01048200.1.p1 GENE.GHUV01048200.1~~GHUV01048200.1.p1  ORF type:complete len:185 (-),score=34.96 GHUV01048200.1:106-660(-)